MRKVSLILAVLLFTVPAGAVVNITCQQIGSSDQVLVSYQVVGELKKVRAFALDITVNNGVISAVDANVATYDPNYNIYPGSIVIVDGDISDRGTAVADPNGHPDTQPGIGTNGITVEMGALYSPPVDPCGPPLQGALLKFTNTVASGNTIVTITENGTRSGVVMTDSNSPVGGVSAPGCTIVRECYPSCRTADYAQWILPAVNKPDCWCIVRQCHADTDNATEYIKNKGYYYVHFKDLGVLLAAWNIREPPAGPGMAWPDTKICADFAHDSEYIKNKGYYRVHFKDLGVLLGSWNVREAPAGPGISPDCLNCP